VKAVTLMAPGRVRLVAESARQTWGDDEVLVEVKVVSLCGSDYQLYQGRYQGPARYPIRPGHEWSGLVLAAGAGVSGLQEGDRVTGDCSIWCGDCDGCRLDKNLCENIEKYGLTQDGFCQERKVVKARHLYPATTLPFSVLALAEPFAVALNSIKKAAPRYLAKGNGRVLIMGAGSIGTALYLLLKFHCGAPHVDIWDVVPQRLEFLRLLVGDNKVGSLPEEHPQEKPSGYHGLYKESGYRLVFEATGSDQAIRLALDVLNPHGQLLVLGMPRLAEVDVAMIVKKALTIRGSIGGTGSFPSVLRFFGKIPGLISSLVTRRYRWQDAEQALVEGADPARSLKTQLYFGKEETSGELSTLAAS
jgi:L-iditol 2-dehydrogenase